MEYANARCGMHVTMHAWSLFKVKGGRRHRHDRANANALTVNTDLANHHSSARAYLRSHYGKGGTMSTRIQGQS